MLGSGCTATRLAPHTAPANQLTGFPSGRFCGLRVFERKNKTLDSLKRTYAECSPHPHALIFIMYFIAVYIKQTLFFVCTHHFFKPQNVFAFRLMGDLHLKWQRCPSAVRFLLWRSCTDEVWADEQQQVISCSRHICFKKRPVGRMDKSKLDWSLKCNLRSQSMSCCFVVFYSINTMKILSTNKWQLVYLWWLQSLQFVMIEIIIFNKKRKCGQNCPQHRI